MKNEVIDLFLGKTRQERIAGVREPTAYMRHSVSGRIGVGPDGLQENELGTARRLGRRSHAVYLLAQDHYLYFSQLLERQLPAGILSENVTYSGPDETRLRIGDTIRVGTALLRLVLPRVPCYKMAHFVGTGPGFPARFSASGKTGIYAAVVEEGEVWRQAPFVVESTCPENATIAELNHAITAFDLDPDTVERVLASPDLDPALGATIKERVLAFRPGIAVPSASGRIVSRHYAAPDVAVLDIEPASGAGAVAKPGQFITVGVETAGGDTHYRCYSLIDGPGAAAPYAPYRIAVRRECDSHNEPSVSALLNGPDVAGRPCRIYPPAGDFVLPERPDRPILFIAGGIGITPILMQIKALLAGDRPVPLSLHYICRDRSHAAFDDELAALAAADGRFSYRLHLTRPSPEHSIDGHISSGRPDIARIVAAAGVDIELFVCGPLGLIEAVRETHHAMGGDGDRLHFELFDVSGAQGTTAQPAPKAHVTIASHDVDGDWTPSRGPLLAWVETETGLRPPAACRSGLCRTCVAGLERGQVTYPSSVKAPPPDQVLLCCAQPTTSELVVNLPAGTPSGPRLEQQEKAHERQHVPSLD
ncbi:MOSC domain-containing protein [Nitratireductor sp. XY-223]|uniref:MOSC domain-containing protein n=1 Tax=Nitratireductor sp. XY-223 TaxID=2561926 RepID=UPI00145B349F|nr:MOSC domain-containing protein [Nitratireductor sp. XY-223]